jgi:predicted MFS family arabinose efflux permease
MTARVVIAVQAVRAFAYGFGSVILGSVLAAEGFSAAGVGAVFTAMLAGMAVTTFAVGRWGDRLGRRRSYLVLLAVMGATGAVYGITASVPALVLAALTGTMSTDANESGPITSLEQAMLADSPAPQRAALFGRYNAAAYLAGSAGALAAAVPEALRRAAPGAPAEQRWLLAFPVLAALCVVLARRLPTATDRHRDGLQRAPLTVSRPSVRRLAGLFAVDAFAGGLVVTSFIVYWFRTRYGASTEVMAIALFAAGLLQGASALLAGWIAPRLGLVNTMVFTHLPSNLLLALVPLMPSLAPALALLLARSALSQMDVPARQAFIAALVEPAERTAAAAYTNTARYVGRPAGPTVAGALIQHSALAAPFVAAGALKSIYDLVIYAAFRTRRLPAG